MISNLKNLKSQISNFRSLQISDLKFQISDFNQVHAKKSDEGRENIAANTLRGTLPSEDGDLADSRKGPRTSSIEGSLPSSLAKVFRLSKN